MREPSFFAELKRRNVLRAGAFYAATAWLLVQVATQVFPFFHIPEWIVRWIVVAALIGFPFALVAAWFYEWTPQGLVRESETGDVAAARSGKALDRWIIAALALAVVLLLTDRFVVHRGADATAVSDKSIAVLPLSNESGDPAQDYFSDGLSEELISALGQVRDLKVIGRNSSFRFRGSLQDDNVAIGVKLGVANLLEGTVRKLGDRVRIVASLIRATDGTQLWSQSYDRELKDVFAVQSDIATAVATALKARLLGSVESGGKPPSGNLDAYIALLRGRDFAERRNREDYAKAAESYNEAIALDPGYALAYARLAMLDQWYDDWAIGTRAERETARDSARANARKAVELNPLLPEAQGALGITQAWSDLDVRSAEATLKRAVALDPSNPETVYQLADVTAALGRLDEAVATMKKVLALDPQNASFHFYTGQYLLALGRLDEAEQELDRAIALQPAAVGYRTYLTMLYVKRGQNDRALATALGEPEGTVNRRIALALAYAASGDEARAKAEVDEMERLDADVWPVVIAEYYAYRGDADRTLSWLERALSVHDPSVTTLWQDPVIFPAMRGDARFAEFCRKVGLPAPA